MAQPQRIDPGGVITADWRSPEPEARDWLGLFKCNSKNTYTEYHNTNGAKGSKPSVEFVFTFC